MADNQLNDTGNAGIGTTSPTEGLLEIKTPKGSADATHGLAQTIDTGTSAKSYFITDGSTDFDWFLTRGGVDANGLKIDKSGNVSAGKNFTIGGSLHISNWEIAAIPDYVFEQDYPLMSLEHLKIYLHLHHHLPGIPGRNDIEGKTLDLVQLSMTLLKKLEELTLYVIAADETQSELTKRLDTLEALQDEPSQ